MASALRFGSWIQSSKSSRRSRSFRFSVLVVRRVLLVIVAPIIAAPAASSTVHRIASADFENELVEVLAKAEPGDELLLPQGRFEMTRQLVVLASDVTIRGQGSDITTLDFNRQAMGAQGVLVLGNRVEIADVRIANSPGDGLVARDVRGFRVSRVAVEWDGALSSTNGAYGIYPVLSQGIEIRDCLTKGASEAGIYVGQSSDAIVEGNRAEGNLVGIDIENSQNVIVRGNRLQGNSIGIVVSTRPGAGVSMHVDVTRNEMVANNAPSVAAQDGFFGSLGDGKGLVISAAVDTNVEKNRFRDHQSVAVLLLNYESLEIIERKPSGYNPNLVWAQLRRNRFEPATIPVEPRFTNWRNATGIDVAWDGINSSQPIHPDYRPTPICRETQEVSRFLVSGRGQTNFTQVVPPCELADAKRKTSQGGSRMR